ncbi:MAG TPA: hypothetical protein PKD20_03490 [Candidatus Saccharibacteria bacterium]|nr:hypothetical protein [Candidatus Saccharibacteria bacterium]HMT55915.1 hypothetical protein [Candidatus Saccharibacteria bacterium]
MQSLDDMLKNRQPKQPPQIEALKRFAKDRYGIEVTVRASRSHYLVNVPGAAHAHRFRMDTAEIIESCMLDKRLVIHIGY